MALELFEAGNPQQSVAVAHYSIFESCLQLSKTLHCCVAI